jgi:type IV pilus assembly protein PilM
MKTIKKKTIFKKSSSIGLDVSDASAEVVESYIEKGSIKIASANRIFLEKGLIENGNIKDADKLAESIKGLFASADPSPIEGKCIIFGLPLLRAYLHLFDLVRDDDGSIDDTVKKEIRNNVPVNIKDLAYSYRLYEDIGASDRKESMASKRQRCLIAAVRYDYLDMWNKCLNQAGLEISEFRLGNIAAFRGLYAKEWTDHSCLLDIGSEITEFSIYKKEGLLYSYSIRFGGSRLARELSSRLNLNEIQSRRLILCDGLKTNDQVAKNAIMDQVADLVREIRLNHDYLKKRSKITVDKVFLLGGTSQMGGLADFLKESFPNVQFEFGRPMAERAKNPVTSEYINALGLSLYGIEKVKGETDPVFSTVDRTNTSWLLHSVRSAIGSINERYFRFAMIGLAAILSLFILIYFGQAKRSVENSNITMAEKSYLGQANIKSSIPIAVNNSFYTDLSIRGRKIETTLKDADIINKAVEASRQLAENSIIQGEALWREPIDLPKGKSFLFPLTLHWIAYIQSDFSKLMSLDAKAQVGQDDIKIQSSRLTGLRPSKIDDMYFMDIEASVLARQTVTKPLKKSNYTEDSGQAITKAPIPESRSAPEKISIESLSGNVNARLQATANSRVIGKLKPQTKYIFIKELNGWYQVRLDEKTSGWVNSKYVKKSGSIN